MKRLTLFLGILLSFGALSQSLDVPFSTNCKTEIDSECYTLHEVRGLDLKGDGFLAVRTGPGSEYRMIDRIFAGDQVYVYATRGSWYGIMYSEGRKGWSHKKWLHQIAG